MSFVGNIAIWSWFVVDRRPVGKGSSHVGLRMERLISGRRCWRPWSCSQPCLSEVLSTSLWFQVQSARGVHMGDRVDTLPDDE